ncbi:MAG: N-acetylmuramoyl-L-alanine amidase [Verrucomicrobiaceae bacterium]
MTASSRLLVSVFVVALTAFLSSCESPAPASFTRGSSGLSEYGNRPGPQGFRTVIVDAGHGGKDSGAVSRRNGLTEKTLTLDMARRVRGELGGFRVVMTRDSDVFVELDDRVLLANKYPDAILVSIHFNESGSRICGPETYWWRVDSYTLGKRIERNLSAASSYHNNRDLVRRRLRLTRNPAIPCVLVECGYISNSSEAKALGDSAYRNKIARAIASAIREQTAVGDRDHGPLPPFIKAPPSRHGDARGS